MHLSKKRRFTLQISGLGVTYVDRDRPYTQFDSAYPSVGKALAALELFNADPQLVGSHQFLPVVLREQKFLKMYYDKDAKQLKFRTKVRPIVEVGHTDSLIYSLYAAKLSQAYEDGVNQLGIELVATAYRRGIGSNIEASKAVIDSVVEMNDCWIIKSDFVGFFDHLNHQVLKQAVSDLVGEKDETGTGSKYQLKQDWYAVIRSLTKYRHIAASNIPDRMLAFAKVHKRYVLRVREIDNQIRTGELVVSAQHQVGIPQGTSMSAVLANVYMIAFDKQLHKLTTSLGGLYRRYSDDFVLVLPGTLSTEKVKMVEQQVANLAQMHARLELETKKTKILRYQSATKKIEKLREDGSLSESVFDYLGFIFDGRHVSLRSRGLFKFTYKARSSIRETAYEQAEVRRGKTKLFLPYLEAYSRTLGTYLDMREEAVSFRGYAARSQQIFADNNGAYGVVIDRQARKVVEKFQKYLHDQRKLYKR
ncbi:hypothetical protein C0674_02715 [Sporolactobacillus terrae]|uniref:Reverse transcriptase domain-containing protein n=1 Tax=Sporolactobacillus terrae TaxID=269673 RepID=A0ABX5QBJ2_9BACL|nr:hypothetical protein C0674_02715 [Sporolactobacillus terrae]QAA26920.1 hypothetical protein C0679_02695 [Sporolactobacillus terrae]